MILGFLVQLNKAIVRAPVTAAATVPLVAYCKQEQKEETKLETLPDNYYNTLKDILYFDEIFSTADFQEFSEKNLDDTYKFLTKQISLFTQENFGHLTDQQKSNVPLFLQSSYQLKRKNVAELVPYLLFLFDDNALHKKITLISNHIKYLEHVEDCYDEFLLTRAQERQSQIQEFKEFTKETSSILGGYLSGALSAGQSAPAKQTAAITMPGAPSSLTSSAHYRRL